MAFAQAKRYAYILRKAFMIPIGITITLAGVIGMVYYLPDYESVNARIGQVQTKLLSEVDRILQDHPDWPLEIKDKLNRYKGYIRDKRFGEAANTARALQETPPCQGNRQVFFLCGDAEINVYAVEFAGSVRRTLVILCGVILIGLGCIALGLQRARQVGHYITSEQLMGNLKKLEMPEFPTKDFLKKLNVDIIRLFLVVNRFGHVVDMELIEGPKVIMPYIVRAVRKWKFDPFIYKGKDTGVFGEIRFNVK
jgi:hypothetical protein